MRAAVVGIVLVAFAGLAGAQPAGTYVSPNGKYTIKFPDTPKVTTKGTETAVGELTVTVATFATAEGNVFLVSHTEFPTVPKAENRGTLFDGVRDGVKGSGKITDDKDIAFGPDKLPGREFVVDKGKQRVRYRVVLRDAKLYQVAAIGTADFVAGRDANQFFESFELTK